MSVREFIRWVGFSLTGRVPGGVAIGQGERVATPDEAEALGLDTRRPCRYCSDPLCPEDCPECGGAIHDLDAVLAACAASAVIDLAGTRQSYGPCTRREAHKGWHEDADGASWKERDDTVGVPRDDLRSLVRVAEHVADDSHAVGMDRARRALGALDNAGLLGQFAEGS
ncbi:hypothetical protein [Streptomyces mutabilis]|uniref:hypothetical protein n=1 Tax=Streptomyces mutabilis TaxID=67332 RepID=UPI0034374EC2